MTEAMYDKIIHLCDLRELAISEFVRDTLEVKLAQESVLFSEQDYRYMAEIAKKGYRLPVSTYVRGLVLDELGWWREGGDKKEE